MRTILLLLLLLLFPTCASLCGETPLTKILYPLTSVLDGVACLPGPDTALEKSHRYIQTPNTGKPRLPKPSRQVQKIEEITDHIDRLNQQSWWDWFSPVWWDWFSPVWWNLFEVHFPLSDDWVRHLPMSKVPRDCRSTVFSKSDVG